MLQSRTVNATSETKVLTCPHTHDQPPTRPRSTRGQLPSRSPQHPKFQGANLQTCVASIGIGKTSATAGHLHRQSPIASVDPIQAGGSGIPRSDVLRGTGTAKKSCVWATTLPGPPSSRFRANSNRHVWPPLTRPIARKFAGSRSQEFHATSNVCSRTEAAAATPVEEGRMSPDQSGRVWLVAHPLVQEPKALRSMVDGMSVLP